MVPFYVLLSTPFPVCASKVVVLLGKASGSLDAPVKGVRDGLEDYAAFEWWRGDM